MSTYVTGDASLQELRERAQRPRAVADVVLLLRPELGERAAVSVDGLEHGVVTETLIAPRAERDRAVDPAGGGDLAAVGEATHRNGAEPRQPLLRLGQVGQRVKELDD